MKRVLVLYFSQTGQLRDIVRSTIAPLEASADIDVTLVELKPPTPYPFPWNFFRFFNTFPETVYEDVEPFEPPELVDAEPFDLVILSYQVWFLSPSLPTTAFLKSETAKRLLAGRPVITLIGCRNMWLMAQERVKVVLAGLGARLIDNIVLDDTVHSAFTFVSTPLWMLTGNKGPFLFGLIPKAGVSPEDVAACVRFGRAIAEQLPERAPESDAPMLRGLGAVSIHEGLIESEKTTKRSFRLWGAFLRAMGKPDSPQRQILILVYFAFLATLVIFVMPVLAAIKMILKPFARKRIAQQREYFAEPSGESTQLLERVV